MDDYDLAQWLLQNAGPCIRFRTLVDILQEQDVGIVSRALDEMLRSPKSQLWISRLNPEFNINSLHSGRENAFENVMGKLVQLGLRAGLQPFDNKTLPFRVWLSENVEEPPQIPHAVFLRTIVASFLAYAGYDTTSRVMAQMKERIDTLYQFARDPDFSSIFVDKSEFKGVPTTSESHNIVNPILYPNQKFMLPWIHDIRGLANCRFIFGNKNYRTKMDTIIEMILTPEYQSLPWNYGLAKYDTGYYVLGWAAHLPGYSSKPEGRKFAELLLTLEFMVRFPAVQKSSWFREMMEYIETFRTESGTFEFPQSWLPEKGEGYWVVGLRMAFDERKENPRAIECESTFRVLCIKQLVMRI
ncbi:hypothetical protein EU527_15615 [Candidatus Thorarchaeota archaeon]|nr:MAG: hypothetical protein EU527_15615 [Candidatus Thorarchaeota archaeon]